MTINTNIYSFSFDTFQPKNDLFTWLQSSYKNKMTEQKNNQKVNSKIKESLKKGRMKKEFER